MDSGLGFEFVEGCLVEIRRAVHHGGADGCRHALQVLHALKGYLNARMTSTGVDPAERLLLRQLVAGARSALQVEDGDDELLLGVLVDLEQMTVCDAHGGGLADGDDVCEAEEEAGPVAMVTEASLATVVCASCDCIIPERRMDAHVRFWCPGRSDS